MAMIETPTESGIILDRRQLLSGAAALGLSATFGAMPAMAQGTPKKGARCAWVWRADRLPIAWTRGPMQTLFPFPRV